MCAKCVEIDQKIEHYRWLANGINDHLTIDRFGELIAEMREQKTALHPETNDLDRDTDRQ
jgi:hypothetical protein